MPKNDIYNISGRVKNHIAKKDIALSPVGNILVNSYTLVLKDIYDWAETIPEFYRDQLNKILMSKEEMPAYVIKLSTPEDEEFETLYDEVKATMSQPRFESNERALEHFEQEYKALGESYGKSGDEFWVEAESSNFLTKDYREIMRLNKCIQMCKYLIEKYKNG